MLALGGLGAGGVVALLLLGTGTAVVERVAPRPAPLAEIALPPSARTPVVFKLDGYRSARFGMDEAAVRAAVRRDFEIDPGALQESEPIGYGTRMLSLLVDGLVQGGGPAQVTYVLGWRQRRLIQVSLIWPGGANRAPDLLPLDRVGEALRRNLLALPLDPAGIVGDQHQPDGSVLLLRVADEAGRVAALARLADGTIHLAYHLDDRNPDRFRIARGDF
jgi:hypothetical protein